MSRKLIGLMVLFCLSHPAFAVYSSSGAQAAVLAALPPVDTNLPAAQQTAQATARQNLAAAIEALGTYIKANMQVASGQAVSTTGSASAQTGSTTSPGTLQ